MMAALADLHFIRPGWLLLAPLAFAVWWLWRRRTDPLRGWREQIAAPLLQALTIGGLSAARRRAHWLLCAWLLAIVAIAGPTWRMEPNPFAEAAAPLMILLKTDSSMAQPPPAPSRLERAQLKVADLAQAWRGQPLGLIAYAGSAHLVLPPTRDTAVVAQMAAEIEPDVMPLDGDRLDLALREAVRVLGDGGQGGSVVVLADTAHAAAALPAAAPVPVQFIAVNTPASPEDQALRVVARALNANVEPLDVDGGDIAAIVRRATRAPASRVGQLRDRWQEAGYWLLPLPALLVLMSFRRENSASTP
jgi:Ca-activated chloride channel homolog